ncbi:24310_t:CDS:1, partial [Racocetra persica]
EINKLKEELKKYKENEPNENLVNENKELGKELDKCKRDNKYLKEGISVLEKM